VARRLDAKVSLDLKGAPLGQAIAILQEAAGVTFVVAEGAQPPVTLTVRDVSAKSVLRLILPQAGLGAVYESGAVVIRIRQALAAPVILKVYDVRSAALKLREFPGPRVELRPRFTGAICIWPYDDVSSGCPKLELLEMLVRDHTGDRSWDEDGRVSMTLRDGLLTVSQTAKVHREIQELLGVLGM
jgi:hypothetical protein